jgi:S-formylglutathione hydrolase FrmB
MLRMRNAVHFFQSRPLQAAAVLLLCLVSALPAAAVARGECRTAPSKILGRAVPYCLLLPPSYDAEKTRRYPILYFLHGLGDNEQMFLHSGGWDLVQDLWESGKLGEYLIVTPAGGTSFFIDSKDGRTRYEDFLVQEFLPFIEGRYRVLPGRAFRGVDGISMGGFGALHLAFHHPELFGSVSAHSAAIVEKPPAINVADTEESGRLRLFGDIFGSPPDRAYWDRVSPLTLARTADLGHLAIYFDCGAQDDYGFNAGAEALHKALDARHIAHEYHIYPGGHDWEYFAAHLPASLEFHSRVFAEAAGKHS